MARLFGLETPAPARARVLELGCAMGGNIIPFAFGHPEAQCVGVDLSARQIAEARRTAEALGLGNMRFETMSIADIAPDFGEFDYILCHGVFSWVPPDVQDRILAVCKGHLSPHGVAVVSYNTLPGWNAVRTLRDVMRYHTARFADPKEKAEQARLLLQFLSEATAEGKNYHTDVINLEIDSLKRFADSYLIHDHLEENNWQFYFHDFMNAAVGKGLQYVGDTNVPSMFVGNMRPDVAKTLLTANDIVRVEQYMDFIVNRRFRSTILCHSGIPLDRNLHPRIAERFFVRGLVQPKTAPDLSADGPTEFVGPISFTVRSRVAAGVFATLAENRAKPIAPRDLYRKTRNRLKKASVRIPIADVREVFLEAALRLFLAGGLQFHTEDGDHVVAPGAKPRVSRMVRHQATVGDWVTNAHHEVVRVAPFHRVLIRHLTGENDRAALHAHIHESIRRGDLSVLIDGVGVTDESLIRSEITRSLDLALDHLAGQALLLA